MKMHPISRVFCQKHTWRLIASHSWTSQRTMSLAMMIWVKRSCAASQVRACMCVMAVFNKTRTVRLPKADIDDKVVALLSTEVIVLSVYRGGILWEASRLDSTRDLWTRGCKEGSAPAAGGRGATGSQRHEDQRWATTRVHFENHFLNKGGPSGNYEKMHFKNEFSAEAYHIIVFHLTIKFITVTTLILRLCKCTYY